MKTILATLKAGLDVSIGFHKIYQMDDGTLSVRLESSLTSPTEKATIAGLRRLLKWMDEELKPNLQPSTK